MFTETLRGVLYFMTGSTTWTFRGKRIYRRFVYLRSGILGATSFGRFPSRGSLKVCQLLVPIFCTDSTTRIAFTPFLSTCPAIICRVKNTHDGKRVSFGKTVSSLFRDIVRVIQTIGLSFIREKLTGWFNAFIKHDPRKF